MASFFTTQRDRQEELLDEYQLAVDTPDKLADRLEGLTLFTRPPEGDFAGSQRVGGSTLDIEAVRSARDFREALRELNAQLHETERELGTITDVSERDRYVQDLLVKIVFQDPDERGNLATGQSPAGSEMFLTWMLSTAEIPEAEDREYQRALDYLDKLGIEPGSIDEETGVFSGEFVIDKENKLVMRRHPADPNTYQAIGPDGDFLENGAIKRLQGSGELGDTEFADLPPDESAVSDLPDPPRYLGGIPSQYRDAEGNVVGGYVSGPSKKNLRIARIADRFDPTDRGYALENLDLSNRPPRYYEWDEAFLFADYDAGQIISVQEAMVAAGFLRPGKFAEGFWDKHSQAAMYEVMDEANKIGGQTWTEVLEAHAERRASMTDDELAEEAGIAKRRRTPYMKPDYDTLTESVVAQFQARLGRKPQPHEMVLLANQMDKNFRAQYNAQDAAAQQVYDQGNREVLFGETPAGVTGQDVDPYASMSASFTKLFGAEEDRVEAGVHSRNTSRQIMNTLAGLESYVGR